MRADEIKKMIDKKGYVARTVFIAIGNSFYNMDVDWEMDYGFNEDILYTLQYNITKLFMEKVRDNLSYYKERIILSERNITRMEKDLKTMSRIDYPDEFTHMRCNEIEQIVLDAI